MNEAELLVASAVSAFEARFGSPPAWIARAPGRVNLIGEHTDYNGGFVLPMAIDRWCVCAGAAAAGPRSRLAAIDLDEAVEVSLAEAWREGPKAGGELTGWARYIVGAIVERSRGLGLRPAPELDIVATSSVPAGGGLSSSAAIETAAAMVLEAASDNRGDGDDFRRCRARDCQRAEHLWAGVPCGLMDQLASSFGRAGHALRIDCRDDSIEAVPLPAPEEAAVLVVNSGVRHALASGEYGRRRSACEAAAAALGVASLRELGSLGPEELSRLTPEQARCVRHVVTENARVLRAVQALRDGDLSAFGALMLESHASLRDDYRVSCDEVDAIVEIAEGVPGVFGARMTGGGFGGCAIMLASPAGLKRARTSLPGAFLARTGGRCEMWTMAASDGADWPAA